MKPKLPPNSKLTPALVRWMRELRAEGSAVCELSDRFDVNVAQVSKICSGAQWPLAGGPITKSRSRRVYRRTLRNRQEAYRRYMAGVRVVDIAADFDMCTAAVYRYIQLEKAARR